MYQHRHHGAGYRHYIQSVVQAKTARSYLEIGVRDGEMLSMISVPSIGVDPNFNISFPITANKKQCHLFQMTSDEFFRDHCPRDILKSEIDIVFLDGLHQFEYLLRDFMNAERCCHQNSVIMLDDCLPLNAEMTERLFEPEKRKHDATSRMWTGDVWKIVPILRKYRPDLHIVVADTQPTGNVAITRLDNSSDVLRNNYYDIIAEFTLIPSNEKSISDYYESLNILSTNEISSGFELSRHLGG